MANCSQCGKELMPGSSFCTYCGAALPQEPVSTAADHSFAPNSPSPAPGPNNTQPYAMNMSPAYTPPPPPLAYNVPPIPSADCPAYVSAPERPKSMRTTFLNSFLSLVILGSLLIIAFNAGIFGNRLFVNPRNIEFIFQQFCFLGVIAMAAVLSTRAKGPDLSIGSLIVLSGSIAVIVSRSGGSILPAILTAVLICAVIGLVNGVLIVYAGMPAILTTLVVGVVIRSVSNLLIGGNPIALNNRDIQSIWQPAGLFIMLILAMIIAVLMIILTPLGTPTYKRDKKQPLIHMFAYMGSGLIAGLAGILLLARLNAVVPGVQGYEPLILLVYGCVMGSRAFDNRFAPGFYALLPALFYAVADNVFNVLQVSFYVQSTILGIIAIGFILTAFLVRPELREKLPSLKDK